MKCCIFFKLSARAVAIFSVFLLLFVVLEQNLFSKSTRSYSGSNQTRFQSAQENSFHNSSCTCSFLTLDEIKVANIYRYAMFTTFLSSESVSNSTDMFVSSCDSVMNRCEVLEAPPTSFRHVAFLHDKVHRGSEYPILSTKNTDALQKAISGNQLQSRPTLNFPSNLPIKAAIGSGMIFLQNGCTRVSGCRMLGVPKMRFLQTQKRCSGYTDQIVSNETVCIVEARGHNRVRCELQQSRSKEYHDYLWVASLGPYYTFQHFVIDKLPDILVAHKLLQNMSGAKYLMVTDKRIIEILEFLGINKSMILNADPTRSFCSRRLLFNAPLPGKYGFAATVNYPRPPELFKYASDQFALRNNKGSKQDLIVYLDRGSVSTRSHQISNIGEVKAVLKRNIYRLKYKQIDASRMSVKNLVSVLQRARIIVGIHGGQMANIIFAQANKGTSIIEIAGRQTYWKSYYYNGMGSVFDYRLVPRLCKSRNSVIHPSDTDLKQKRCSSNLFVSIVDFETSFHEALNHS